MNSLFALFALMLAATCQVPMFITYMAQRITGVSHWLRGAIAATQKKPDESKSQPVKGCDENGIPLDPNHHWNREKSPATEFSRTAPSPYTRGRT